MSEPINLGAVRAERENDNTKWTPVECLRDVIDSIEDGSTHVDRMMVIRVDCRNGKFDVGYNTQNLSGSQAIALLEVAKILILQDIGYIKKEN